jgi:hypothetical protein
VNGRGRVGCFAYKSCFARSLAKEVRVATKSETEAEAEGQRLLGGLGIPENHEYLTRTRTHSGSAVSGFSLPLDRREATRKRMQGPGGLPFPFSVCSVMADLARTRSVLSPWTRTFRLYDSSIFTPRHIPLDFYGPMRCCYDSTILGRSFAHPRSSRGEMTKRGCARGALSYFCQPMDPSRASTTQLGNY